MKNEMYNIGGYDLNPKSCDDANLHFSNESLRVGKKYNWINQPERLVYLGNNWSGNGYWHQFAKVETPETVWCEVLDSDLKMIEETIGS